MTQTTPSSNGPLLALVCSSMLWGLIWLPLKYFANLGFGSLALLFVAYGVLAVISLPIIIRHAGLLHHEWRVFALVFLFGGYANVAFSTSMMYGNVVRSMTLFYTLPVWALIGGYIFLGEAITRWRTFSALCALIGAWLILGGMNIFAAPPGWVDFLAVSSGFAYAMNNLCFRATPHLAIAPKISTMFISASFFCAMLLWCGVEVLPQVSTSLWLLASAFGVCWILLANIGSQWGVTHMEAGRSAIIIVLELVVAVISSYFLSDIHLSATEWVGAGLILLAALMEARG